MGQTNLPKILIDAESEIPEAAKWNNNFSFLNFTQGTLIRNGDFENFAAAVPDNWALSGAGAAVAVDADSKRGAIAAELTFGAAAAVLSQSATGAKFAKGRKVKAWIWIKASVANQARIRIWDGIAASVSNYHTGGGAYELLIVEHDTAVGATTLDIECRVEIAGSALFDAVVLVDFESALGYHENPRDFASPTKEVFFHLPKAHGGNLADYRIFNLGSAGAERILFNVPHDFASLMSCVLVAVPSLTAGPQTVQLHATYAKVGEDATSVTESNPTKTYSYTANQMMELDLSSVLTGIGAGDYVGILFDRQVLGLGDLRILGVKLRYA